MAQWFCIVGGQQYGPVTEEVLRSWAQAGRLRPADYVWREGMPEWAPAATVHSLFPPVAPAEVQGVPPRSPPPASRPTRRNLRNRRGI